MSVKISDLPLSIGTGVDSSTWYGIISDPSGLANKVYLNNLMVSDTPYGNLTTGAKGFFNKVTNVSTTTNQLGYLNYFENTYVGAFNPTVWGATSIVVQHSTIFALNRLRFNNGTYTFLASADAPNANQVLLWNGGSADNNTGVTMNITMGTSPTTGLMNNYSRINLQSDGDTGVSVKQYNGWASAYVSYYYNGGAAGSYLSNFAHFAVGGHSRSGSVTCDNMYGLYIPTLTTNGVTNGWGIYQSDAADKNYFAGKLLIGTSTSSSYILDLVGTSRFTGSVNATGSITASGALARGVYFNNTLVAAANNDVLVGLDIAPTFTVGAFTGVTSYGLRITGKAIISQELTTTGGILTANPIVPSSGSVDIGSSATNGFRTIYAGTYNISPNSTYATFGQSNTYGILARRLADANGAITITDTNSYTNSNAVLLSLESTTRGFRPPRMTTTQKNAIASPVAGLIVYDTTLNKLCVYTTAWQTITSA